MKTTNLLWKTCHAIVTYGNGSGQLKAGFLAILASLYFAF